MAKEKTIDAIAKLELQQQQAIKDKIESSQYVVDDIRLQIFAPVTQITHGSIFDTKKRTVQTSWGSCTVYGPTLTQVHRDVLDCIFAVGEINITESGCVVIKFAPVEVLSLYGGEGCEHNHAWLRDKIRDFGRVQIGEKVGKKEVGYQLIWGWGFDKTEKGKYVIAFSQNYIAHMLGSLTLSLDLDGTGRLVAIKSSFVKSLIRHMITQKVGYKIYLDNYLSWAGYETAGEKTKRAKRELVLKHASVLDAWGIQIEGGKKKLMLKYKHAINRPNYQRGCVAMAQTKWSSPLTQKFAKKVITELLHEASDPQHH